MSRRSSTSPKLQLMLSTSKAKCMRVELQLTPSRILYSPTRNTPFRINKSGMKGQLSGQKQIRNTTLPQLSLIQQLTPKSQSKIRMKHHSMKSTRVTQTESTYQTTSDQELESRREMQRGCKNQQVLLIQDSTSSSQSSRRIVLFNTAILQLA